MQKIAATISSLHNRRKKMSENQVKRLFKIAKFLKIKYNEKTMNIFDFQDYLYEKMMEWEEENQMEFPII